MKEVWSKSWKKVLIWASGYVSFLAFVVAGGYVIVKGQEEDVKRTAKQCFIVSLLFLAVDALTTIFNNINVFAASRGFQEFMLWFSFIVTLIRIAVFTTVIIMTLVNAKMETTVRAAVEEQKKNEANKENEGKTENQ